MALGNIVKNFGDAVTGKQSSTKYQSKPYSGFSEVGYTSKTGDGSLLPLEYLVRISSTNLNGGITVIGAMQDKLDFSVTSDWSSIVPTAPIPIAALFEGITGRSLVSSFMTRRMWVGTTPITLALSLVFESIDDTYLNVVAPTIALMQMALPSRGMVDPAKAKSALDKIKSSVINSIGQAELFLVPPGPDPFFQDRGDTISVEIGTQFEFDNVIIHSVRPAWDFSRVDSSGWPMRSEVILDIQTYELMTRDRLQGDRGVIRNG